MIRQFLENSRALQVAFLIGALALLGLVASDLGGEMPNRAALKNRPNPTDVTELGRKMETLFSPDTLGAARPGTNGVSPFYTTHFQPPAPPAKTPEPVAAKATTKKIQVIFQGVYETASGEKKAFIKVGDGLKVGAAGLNVVADWAVAEITLRTLTLKSAANQTNLLEFNVPKEIEVPNP